MLVEFFPAGGRDSDNVQASPARLLNFYRENLNGVQVLKSVPGTYPMAALTGVFMRAMMPLNDLLYVVHGGQLWTMDGGGTATALGTVADDAATSISRNNGKILVASGGQLRSFTGNASVAVEPGQIGANNVGSVTFWAQRTVITERNGRTVEWSDVADAETWSSSFATAEERDDAIIRAMPIAGQLWVFKETSIERWYLTGGSDFAAPLAGGLIGIGLKGFNLVAEVPNGAAFVGSDNVVYLVAGGLAPVSNRAVETQIKAATPGSMFYVEDEGHKFIVLRWPDRPAWVYDLATNEWHERAEGSTLGAWEAVQGAVMDGRSYVGTDLGQMRLLGRFNQDADKPLIRRAVSGIVRLPNGKYPKISAVEVFARTGFSTLGRFDQDGLMFDGGFALDAGGSGLRFRSFDQARRPGRIGLRISADRGVTWGRERLRGVGDSGQYEQRCVWRALGVPQSNGKIGNTAVLELTISDPAEISVEAIGEITVS